MDPSEQPLDSRFTTEGQMKPHTIGLTLAFCLAAVAAGAGTDAQTGTWKLNEAKSTLAAGAVRNSTVVYEVAGDDVKVTVDGTDRDGKSAHNEWTGKFDGKDYSVTGDPTVDTRAYTRVDDRTLAMTIKKAGAVTTTGRIVVSADDKTRTVSTSGTDSKGQKFTSTAVYDKQ
jgi:hypothetical protein